jgi:ankyrin repeat protein
MPTDSPEVPRTLPDRANLQHLKNQAKDLFNTGEAESLTEAQFKIARLYGFASWPKLKAHVDSLEEFGQLKQAIDTNDLQRMVALMTQNPRLHRAPLGYGKNGPLTWVAECRIPWEPPSPVRLKMAEWMIDHGSDVHQGGDGPLMRAALRDERIPMMALLVSRGADVNALWSGYFPIIFAPCETLAPLSLKWLLDRGANPNCANPERKHPGTALDYVIGTYSRSEELATCIDILLEAGGKTRYASVPPVLDLLRGRLEGLRKLLDADPGLIRTRFDELDFGSTAARQLKLRGGTLLHVAAEYGNVEAANLLPDRGADVNACATVDEAGVGGQTPIFHAATQFYDWGLPMAQFLIERGADLSVRVRLPGHYERAGEVVECTPLGYALRFPSSDGRNAGKTEGRTIALLLERGAPE